MVDIEMNNKPDKPLFSDINTFPMSQVIPDRAFIP